MAKFSVLTLSQDALTTMMKAAPVVAPLTFTAVKLGTPIVMAGIDLIKSLVGRLRPNDALTLRLGPNLAQQVRTTAQQSMSQAPTLSLPALPSTAPPSAAPPTRTVPVTKVEAATSVALQLDALGKLDRNLVVVAVKNHADSNRATLFGLSKGDDGLVQVQRLRLEQNNPQMVNPNQRPITDARVTDPQANRGASQDSGQNSGGKPSSQHLSNGVTTKQPTQAETATKQPTQAETATKQPTQAETATKQPTQAETATKQPTQAETATKQPTQAETATKQPTQAETATKQPTQAETATKQPTQAETATKQPTQAETATKQPTQAETATKQPTQAETATKQPTQAETATKQLTQAETATKQLTQAESTVKQDIKTQQTKEGVAQQEIEQHATTTLVADGAPTDSSQITLSDEGRAQHQDATPQSTEKIIKTLKRLVKAGSLTREQMESILNNPAVMAKLMSGELRLKPLEKLLQTLMLATLQAQSIHLPVNPVANKTPTLSPSLTMPSTPTPPQPAVADASATIAAKNSPTVVATSPTKNTSVWVEIVRPQSFNPTQPAPMREAVVAQELRSQALSRFDAVLTDNTKTQQKIVNAELIQQESKQSQTKSQLEASVQAKAEQTKAYTEKIDRERKEQAVEAPVMADQARATGGRGGGGVRRGGGDEDVEGLNGTPILSDGIESPFSGQIKDKIGLEGERCPRYRACEAARLGGVTNWVCACELDQTSVYSDIDKLAQVQ